MVRGLDLFRKHFEDFVGQYLLIGGTACNLVMNEAGQKFRATQDLDIVLCAEALTDDFIAAFWGFIKAGDYSIRERADGKKEFFRFKSPEDERFPKELELFSRKPDSFVIPDGWTLTPIPASDDISSLSAILLDDDYYDWITGGARLIDGISIVGAEYLIPLKMKAWIDLSERKVAGETIDSKKIRKHCNDVFRLYVIMAQVELLAVPDLVRNDIREFISKVVSEEIDFKNLQLGSLTMEDALSGLKHIYGIGS